MSEVEPRPSRWSILPPIFAVATWVSMLLAAAGIAVPWVYEPDGDEWLVWIGAVGLFGASGVGFSVASLVSALVAVWRVRAAGGALSGQGVAVAGAVAGLTGGGLLAAVTGAFGLFVTVMGLFFYIVAVGL